MKRDDLTKYLHSKSRCYLCNSMNGIEKNHKISLHRKKWRNENIWQIICNECYERLKWTKTIKIEVI